MNIRAIGYEDMIPMEYNRCICFKMGVDFDTRRREIEEKKDSLEGRWGAFDEDGSLMSYLIDNPFEVWFDGQAVSCGGIGSVTTLPEYRASGSMRALLTHTIHKAYEKGEVLSMLGPFSYEFYRKFGYEFAYSGAQFTFPVTQLRSFRHTGWAKRIHGSEERDLSQILSVIERFGRHYNLSLVRNEHFLRTRWLKKTDEGFMNDHTFLYLLGEGDQAGAYVMYRHAGEGVLNVLDVAYDGIWGFRMLMGFLARMSADYRSISIRLPAEANLQAILPDPAQVALSMSPVRMVRVVNVQKALGLMRKPSDIRVVLEVADDLLPENNGRYLVTGERVEKTDEAPDLSVDIRALAPMVVGTLPLESAIYRSDVTVHDHREALEKLFISKPVFQLEHF